MNRDIEIPIRVVCDVNHYNNILAIDLFAGKRNFSINVNVQNNTLMIIFITSLFH